MSVFQFGEIYIYKMSHTKGYYLAIKKNEGLYMMFPTPPRHPAPTRQEAQRNQPCSHLGRITKFLCHLLSLTFLSFFFFFLNIIPNILGGP